MWLSSLLLVATGVVVVGTASILPRADADLSNCPGYAASNVVVTDSGLTADLKIDGEKCNAYGPDLEELKLVVEHQSDDRLHVKIYDSGLNMYQVQESVLPRPVNNKAASSGAALRFNLVEKPFSFKVTRNSNHEVLFDTAIAPLVYETQYIRLRTSLPENPNIYGLGEHSDSFRLKTEDYTRSLYALDRPNIPNNFNLYGSHPVYFDHRGDKGTHGVFLLNANAMNVILDKDDKGQQYLEYNTIGGVLDFYFLAGSKPSDVSKQYADVVGYSAMYPYWSLGFHQCKYGYWDVNMVAEVVANYSNVGIPLEVMWTDIDYMGLRRDFTLDEERFSKSKMRKLVDTLHKRGQRYILILDPAIAVNTSYQSYLHGKEMDVFLKSGDGSRDFLGVQWAGASVFPDWFHPKAQKWWSDEVTSFFHKDKGIDVDGIWIDMNEAANFCPDLLCDPNVLANTGHTPPPYPNPPRNNTGRPIKGFPKEFQPSNPVKTRQVGERGYLQPTGKTFHYLDDFKPSAYSSSKPMMQKDVKPDQDCPRQGGQFNQMKGTVDRDALAPKYAIQNPKNNHLSDYTLHTWSVNCDGTQQIDTHNLYGHMMATTTHTSMLNRRPALRPFVLTRSTWAGTGRHATHWFGDNASTWEHYRTSIRQMLAFVSMHQMPLVGSDICGFNDNANPLMCARWATLGAFQPFYRNHASDGSIFQEFFQWNVTIQAAKKAINTRYKLLDYAYTALYYQTTTGVPMINPLFFLYPNDEATFGIQEQWFYGDALLVSPVTTDFSDTVTFYLPRGRFYDYWTHMVVEGEGRNETLSNIGWSDIPVHIRGGTIIPEREKSALVTRDLRKEAFVITVAPDTNGKAKGRLYLDDGESLHQKAISEISFSYDNGKFVVGGTFAYGNFNLKTIVVLGQTKAGRIGKLNEGKAEIVVPGPGALAGPWEFVL